MSPLATFRKAFLLVHRWLVRRRDLAIGALFTGLTLNVLVQDGVKPFLVLLGAGVGCVVAWSVSLYTAGASAVRHSRREAAEIERLMTQAAKELNR